MTQREQAEESSEPPTSDLFDLALRLRPDIGRSVSRFVETTTDIYRIGHTEPFFVTDLVDTSVHTVQATVRVVTEHAYWYLDDTLGEVPLEVLQNAAEEFESSVHPALTGALGDIWSPGVDNDPRLTVLNTRLNGAAGYFGSQDEYPSATHSYSNEREIVYMDGGLLLAGVNRYLTVLAHELQHAIHWNADPGEDAWINEGLSEVATGIAGFAPSFVGSFLRQPSTQLNHWPEEISQTAPSYGAATLFLTYVAQHYGGQGGLRSLVKDPMDGVEGMESYLSRFGTSFLEVFKDWVVANFLGEREGTYGYGDLGYRVESLQFVRDYGERTAEAPQLSASYTVLQLAEDAVVLRFKGNTEVAQVPTECRSKSTCWWGNRGDSIDSTLTRELDLTEVSEATLDFWTWFAVEEDWDYAYVEVSTDGGATWAILEGGHTTAENPLGNSYGPGFTGRSDGWVQERIDLTPYVEGQVLLRFEYVTDDGVYLDGFVIDDVAVPQLGFLDDAESDSGWDARGFVRTRNRLPQHYFVQVIEQRSDGTNLVRDVELDDENTGEVLIKGLDTELTSAVIVVSPATPGTHVPARYTLTVAPSEPRQ